MTNNNKNINELVTDDDDPTAELEALVLPVLDVEAVHESTIIADLKSDLTSHTETISRLQFDMARLHAKGLGLEAEIQAREQVGNQLHTELGELKNSLKRKTSLVKKRDLKLKTLRAEIRERNDANRRLQEEFDALNKQLAASEDANLQLQEEFDALNKRHAVSDDTNLRLQEEFDALNKQLAVSTDEQRQQDELILALQTGQSASSEHSTREIRQRYLRLEEYADQLRQQIQDRDSETGSDKRTLDALQLRLQEADTRCAAVQNNLADVEERNKQLTEELASLRASHTDEIRMIRFELGEAQDTVTEHELLTEQLASDLVETQTYRVELEGMLSESEKIGQSRIKKLENENLSLRRELDDLQNKLETKSEAISCLLSEWAKKTRKMESTREMSEVKHELDDRNPVERDRITRVLVGSIDDQELRFPLFKDRLTIGRTAQNDIQLKASHISRRHAVIVTEGSATRVIDWGSKNGIFVNSNRVTEHFLRNGDVVTVGTADFRYEERPKRDAGTN